VNNKYEMYHSRLSKYQTKNKLNTYGAFGFISFTADVEEEPLFVDVVTVELCSFFLASYFTFPD